jgi:hypothetical protein
MTSTSPIGTLVSVASLLGAHFYQENHDRNHKLWNIVSTEIFILHMQLPYIHGNDGPSNGYDKARCASYLDLHIEIDSETKKIISIFSL